eukprot:GILI01009350.1.p1 GENE.GILI01009350.1~~GILI01009350.1.p1  ORF type:complete len:286 (-),score=60.89 GILI01009350.1:331-1188(-)
MPERLFEYSKLKDEQDEVIKQLHDHGYIAVIGVEGREDLYMNFLKELQAFIALPEEERKKSTPENSYEQGYSVGTEVLEGVPDTHKSSFYGNVKTPESVWPIAVPNFKNAFMALHEMNTSVGHELLELIGQPLKEHFVNSRALHYLNVQDRKEGSSLNWCGMHRDHSVLTCLAPAYYIKDGQRIPAPEDSGLFIRGHHVKGVPMGAILFQIGETLELMTNGKVIATDHWVQKAFNCERLTYVSFISPKEDYVINSDCGAYSDRYQPGMTFKEFETATYKKYYSAD